MDLIWITHAKYLSDYKIHLIFNNGYEGTVDLKDSIKEPLFKPLQNKDYFKTFSQNSWTIEWNCNLDFAPEYLYKLALKNINKSPKKI